MEQKNAKLLINIDFGVFFLFQASGEFPVFCCCSAGYRVENEKKTRIFKYSSLWWKTFFFLPTAVVGMIERKESFDLERNRKNAI